MMSANYDALLLVSFGGPEGPDDVLPFLENVLRGRNVPRQRMLEVAEHYYHFGGVSPINAQNRDLIQTLQQLLDEQGPRLPIYWGNRNWQPYLTDTLRQMADDGVQRAWRSSRRLSAPTPVAGSIGKTSQAQQQVGPRAPQVDKLRMFYNHPGFIQSLTDRVQAALAQVPPERRAACPLVFTRTAFPWAWQRIAVMSNSCGRVAG